MIDKGTGGRLGIAPQGYDERLLLAVQTLLSAQQKLGAETLQPSDYGMLSCLINFASATAPYLLDILASQAEHVGKEDDAELESGVILHTM